MAAIEYREYMLPEKETAYCSISSLSTISPRSESKKEDLIRKQVRFNTPANADSAQTAFEEDDRGPVKDSPAEESR